MANKISTFISLLFCCIHAHASDSPIVYGVLSTPTEAYTDSSIMIKPDMSVEFKIFGLNLNRISHLTFATDEGQPNASCEHSRNTNSFILAFADPLVPTSYITLRELTRRESAFYLCILDNKTGSWVYAGNQSPISIKTISSLLPIWIQVIMIIVLFFLSGLFSGLNLGLMSLNKTELKIIETAGSRSEKQYARAIRPIREKGNLLLCTLLLGNVLVNTSLTILMDDLTGNGIYAVIGSTIGITIFGEIMPQAVCSRHGLAVGARTLLLTKFFIILTFPLAFPISFLLDKILGEEMGQVYSRDKLAVLIREQVDAGTVLTQEQKIITGALAMTTKTVADVMTPLNDAFMLSYTDSLNFNVMNEIYSNGYSRIPVYDKDRRNIKSLLHVKDLAFINPDDYVPVATVCEFYDRPILVVMDKHSLGTMLKEFLNGRTHIAFVERLVVEGEGDPDKEIIGLVTLEDVIEEIIADEIIDETDIVHVPAFHESLVSYSVLQSFLNADVIFELIFNSLDEEANILYSPKQWTHHAILILQGRALVQIGVEHLHFEAGPFVMFGETVLNRVNEIFPDASESIDASNQSARLASEARFIPDYLVRAVTNIQYVRITAEHYLLAKKLSLHQKAATTFPHRSPAVTQSHQINNTSSAALNSSPTSASDDCVVNGDLFQSAWESQVGRLLAQVPPAHSTTAGATSSSVDPGKSERIQSAPSMSNGSSSTTSPQARPQSHNNFEIV